jgi:hypothetical protein
MGMFDYINYKGEEYQTKDTPKQLCDKYKIETDENGDEYLWTEEYDAEWIVDENYFLGAYIKNSNERWERCDDFTGNIVFYRNVDKTYKKWNQYNAIFVKGKMIEITKWEGSEYE